VCLAFDPLFNLVGRVLLLSRRIFLVLVLVFISVVFFPKALVSLLLDLSAEGLLCSLFLLLQLSASFPFTCLLLIDLVLQDFGLLFFHVDPFAVYLLALVADVHETHGVFFGGAVLAVLLVGGALLGQVRVDVFYLLVGGVVGGVTETRFVCRVIFFPVGLP